MRTHALINRSDQAGDEPTGKASEGDSGQRRQTAGSIVIAFAFASACAAPPNRSGGEEHRLSDAAMEYAPGELIVRFRAYQPPGSAALRALNSQHRLARMHRIRSPYLQRHRLLRTAVGPAGISDEPASIAEASSASTDARHQVPDAAGGLYRLQFEDPAADMEALARQYARDPAVRYAHPNYRLELAAVPNDPRYGEQWAHPLTAAPAGWDRSTGDSNVVIAVVDTGVDYNHPDLTNNMWTNPGEVPGNGIDDDGNGYIDDVRGWDFVDVTNAGSFDSNEDIGPADNDPMDFLGHGTAVAGVISAEGNNNRGVAGVCWRCRIMPLRVGVAQRELRPLGGRAYVLVSWVAEAVEYAAAAGADVINLSILDNNWPSVLRDAIDAAHARDIVVVAAAGNYGEGQPRYPAAYDGVIGVAASDRNDQRAVWGVPQPPLYTGQASSFGTWVDVAAPGSDILSTNVGAGYATASGTSLAAALVSGLAGLLRSLRPEFNRNEVLTAIRSGAAPLRADKYIGSGRIDIDQTLSMTAVPVARIAAPAPDQTIGGNSVIIRGTAAGPNFASYTLRYGRGLYPTSWTLIASANTPVADGTLGTWDLSPVADNAAYVLELRVSDGVNTSRAESLVYVQKSVPSGWPRTLDGRIVGDGIALANVDPNDAALEIAVTTRRNLGGPNTAYDVHLFNHDGSELVGWPKTNVNRQLSAPTLADLTGDGDLEVIVGGYDRPGVMRFHAFSRTGAYAPGWPQTVNATYEFLSATPSVGDLDGDGTPEIVFASAQNSAPGTARAAHIHIYNHDGTVYAGNASEGWPKSIPLNFSDGTGSVQDAASHAALGDLDGDGTLEIVVGLGFSGTTRLHAYHPDGSVVSGFHVDFDSEFTPYPVLADLDGNGSLEIIATSPGGTINVFRADGTIYPESWPQDIGSASPRGPAVADLDGDGDLEIIVNGGNDQVFVFHHDGTPMTGWPASTTPIPGGPFWPVSLVADVSGDGLADVIQGSADQALVYAWEASGQRANAWPSAVAHPIDVAPAAGDIDANGQLDLVVAARDQLLILRLGTATQTAQWPMAWFDAAHAGRFDPTLGALLGDLNADGLRNTIDVQLMVNVILGVENDASIVARADLDRDARHTVTDLQRLVNLILG